MKKLKSGKVSLAITCASIFLLAACGQNQETSQGAMGTSEDVAQGKAGSGEPVSPYTPSEVGAMSAVPTDPSTPPPDAVTPPGVAGTPGTAGTAANPSPAVIASGESRAPSDEGSSSGERK